MRFVVTILRTTLLILCSRMHRLPLIKWLLLLQVFLYVVPVLVCLYGTMAHETATATATTQPAEVMGVSDADIYNFALNLEYLEVS